MSRKTVYNPRTNLLDICQNNTQTTGGRFISLTQKHTHHTHPNEHYTEGFTHPRDEEERATGTTPHKGQALLEVLFHFIS